MRAVDEILMNQRAGLNFTICAVKSFGSAVGRVTSICAISSEKSIAAKLHGSGGFFANRIAVSMVVFVTLVCEQDRQAPFSQTICSKQVL